MGGSAGAVEDEGMGEVLPKRAVAPAPIRAAIRRSARPVLVRLAGLEPLAMTALGCCAQPVADSTGVLGVCHISKGSRVSVNETDRRVKRHLRSSLNLSLFKENPGYLNGCHKIRWF